MSPRIPGRHDQPLEPLEMTEADAVVFAQQISTAVSGRAGWLRACACNHPAKFHSRGRCMLCACQGGFRAANHEVMLVDLHPDAVNYLPPDVTVLHVDNKVKTIGSDGRGGTVMGYTYLLSRDFDFNASRVTRAGVRKETDIWTSTPDDPS